MAGGPAEQDLISRVQHAATYKHISSPANYVATRIIRAQRPNARNLAGASVTDASPGVRLRRGTLAQPGVKPATGPLSCAHRTLLAGLGGGCFIVAALLGVDISSSPPGW